MPRHKTKKRASAQKPGLEVYAFWTGFASTIISLLHVVLIATK